MLYLFSGMVIILAKNAIEREKVRTASYQANEAIKLGCSLKIPCLFKTSIYTS